MRFQVKRIGRLPSKRAALVVLRTMCCLFLVFEFQSVRPCAADDSKTLNRIVDAWRARQTKIQTISATWSETDKNPAEQDPAATVEPIVSLQLGATTETLLESYDVIFTDKAPKKGFYREKLSIDAFDGSSNFMFRSAESTDRWPTGIVWKDQKNDQINSMQLRPWLLHCRPLAAVGVEQAVKNLKLIKPDDRIDRRVCTVIERTHPNSPLKQTYWLDPARDFIILKALEQARGRSTFELNAEYQADREIGWIPKSWKAVMINSKTSIYGELSSYKVNPVFEKSDFQVKFPVGSIVFDRDLGYRYLCLPENKRRIITPGESAGGFRYEDLLKTKSGELEPASPKK